jgi:hypothetical protein
MTDEDRFDLGSHYASYLRADTMAAARRYRRGDILGNQDSRTMKRLNQRIYEDPDLSAYSKGALHVFFNEDEARGKELMMSDPDFVEAARGTDTLLLHLHELQPVHFNDFVPTSGNSSQIGFTPEDPTSYYIPPNPQGQVNLPQRLNQFAAPVAAPIPVPGPAVPAPGGRPGAPPGGGGHGQQPGGVVHGGGHGVNYPNPGGGGGNHPGGGGGNHPPPPQPVHVPVQVPVPPIQVPVGPIQGNQFNCPACGAPVQCPVCGHGGNAAHVHGGGGGGNFNPYQMMINGVPVNPAPPNPAPPNPAPGHQAHAHGHHAPPNPAPPNPAPIPIHVPVHHAPPHPAPLPIHINQGGNGLNAFPNPAPYPGPPIPAHVYHPLHNPFPAAPLPPPLPNHGNGGGIAGILNGALNAVGIQNIFHAQADQGIQTDFRAPGEFHTAEQLRAYLRQGEIRKRTIQNEIIEAKKYLYEIHNQGSAVRAGIEEKYQKEIQAIRAQSGYLERDLRAEIEDKRKANLLQYTRSYEDRLKYRHEIDDLKGQLGLLKEKYDKKKARLDATTDEFIENHHQFTLEKEDLINQLQTLQKIRDDDIFKLKEKFQQENEATAAYILAAGARSNEEITGLQRGLQGALGIIHEQKAEIDLRDQQDRIRNLRIQEEHRARIRALEQEHEDFKRTASTIAFKKVADITRRYDQEALKQQLLYQRAHKAKVAGLKAKFNSKLTSSVELARHVERGIQEGKHQNVIDQLARQHKQELQDKDRQHHLSLQDLQTKFNDDITRVKEERAQQLNKMQQKHESQLKEKEAAIVKEAAAKFGSDLKARSDFLLNETSAIKQQHLQEIESLKSTHLAEQRASEARNQAIIKDQRQEHNRLQEERKAQHQAELLSATVRAEDASKAVEARLNAHHQKELDASRDEFLKTLDESDADHQSQIQRLKEAQDKELKLRDENHQRDLDAEVQRINRLHAAEVDKLQQQHDDERRNRSGDRAEYQEQERKNVIRMEQLKSLHQQELAEQRQKLLDEREKDLQALSQKHQSDVASLTDRHVQEVASRTKELDNQRQVHEVALQAAAENESRLKSLFDLREAEYRSTNTALTEEVASRVAEIEQNAVEYRQALARFTSQLQESQDTLQEQKNITFNQATRYAEQEQRQKVYAENIQELTDRVNGLSANLAQALILAGNNEEARGRAVEAATVATTEYRKAVEEQRVLQKVLEQQYQLVREAHTERQDLVKRLAESEANSEQLRQSIHVKEQERKDAVKSVEAYHGEQLARAIANARREGTQEGIIQGRSTGDQNAKDTEAFKNSEIQQLRDSQEKEKKEIIAAYDAQLGSEKKLLDAQLAKQLRGEEAYNKRIKDLEGEVRRHQKLNEELVTAGVRNTAESAHRIQELQLELQNRPNGLGDAPLPANTNDDRFRGVLASAGSAVQSGVRRLADSLRRKRPEEVNDEISKLHTQAQLMANTLAREHVLEGLSNDEHPDVVASDYAHRVAEVNEPILDALNAVARFPQARKLVTETLQTARNIRERKFARETQEQLGEVTGTRTRNKPVRYTPAEGLSRAPTSSETLRRQRLERAYKAQGNGSSALDHIVAAHDARLQRNRDRYKNQREDVLNTRAQLARALTDNEILRQTQSAEDSIVAINNVLDSDANLPKEVIKDLEDLRNKIAEPLSTQNIDPDDLVEISEDEGDDEDAEDEDDEKVPPIVGTGNTFDSQQTAHSLEVVREARLAAIEDQASVKLAKPAPVKRKHTPEEDDIRERRLKVFEGPHLAAIADIPPAVRQTLKAQGLITEEDEAHVARKLKAHRALAEAFDVAFRHEYTTSLSGQALPGPAERRKRLAAIVRQQQIDAGTFDYKADAEATRKKLEREVKQQLLRERLLVGQHPDQAELNTRYRLLPRHRSYLYDRNSTATLLLNHNRQVTEVNQHNPAALEGERVAALVERQQDYARKRSKLIDEIASRQRVYDRQKAVNIRRAERATQEAAKTAAQRKKKLKRVHTIASIPSIRRTARRTAASSRVQVSGNIASLRNT